MMELHDLDVRHLKDIPGYKPILKAILKSQIQQLVEQLSKFGGEESVLLSASLTEGTLCHLGSKKGKNFLAGRDEIKSQFLSFCLKDGGEEEEEAETDSTASPSKGKGDKRKQKAVKPGPKKKVVHVTLSKPPAGKSKEELTEMVSKMFSGKFAPPKSTPAGKSTPQSKDRRNTRSMLNQTHNSSSKKDKKENDNSGTPSTARAGTLRSGRAVSKRFLDGIALLKGKRGLKEEEDIDVAVQRSLEETASSPDVSDDDSYDQDIGDAGDNTIDEESFGDTEWSEKTLPKELVQIRDLALPLMEELQQSGQKATTDDVQVVVSTNEEGSTQPSVKVELEDEIMDDTNDDYDEMYQEEVELNTKLVTQTPTLGRRTLAAERRQRKLDPDWRRLRVRPKKRTDKTPVTCDVCGMTIIGKNNLSSHKKRIHLGQKDHKCKICDRGFWSGHDRDSHVLSVHTRQCSECNTYVTESEPWTEGMNNKTLREVICVCGAEVQIFSSFGRKKIYADKEKRERVRSDTKYACGTCGKLFLKRGSCERHQKCHSDVKSHVCYVCGTAFSYNNSLTKHLRNEHAILDNVCDICGKCLATPTSLRIHISKHHKLVDGMKEMTVVGQVSQAGAAESHVEEEMEEVQEASEGGVHVEEVDKLPILEATVVQC